MCTMYLTKNIQQKTTHLQATMITRLLVLLLFEDLQDRILCNYKNYGI